MKKNLQDDYSEENYDQDEKLAQQRPGLFATSPLWFRHSEYEHLGRKPHQAGRVFKEGFDGNMFIKPKPEATIEHYRPFEVFEEIIGDFITLALNIKDVDQNTGSNDEGDFDYKEWIETLEFQGEHVTGKVVDDKEGIAADYKKAALIAEFIKKYGPFGIFWEGISHAYFDEQDEGLGLIVFPKLEGPIRYDDYAEHFFPKLKRPYPCLEKSQKQKDIFFVNYTESIQDILENRTFQSLVSHIYNWRDFTLGEYKPGDKHPKYNATWETVLNISFDRINLGFGLETKLGMVIKEDGFPVFDEIKEWQLSWRFNNLIQALAIMHFMNMTGKMGGGVRVCALDGCNRPVLGKDNIKYCSPQHGQNKRRRKYYKEHGK